MLKLLLIALLFCVGASVAATGTSRNHKKVKEAIRFVQSRIPELRANRLPSGDQWTSSLFKIMKELNANPEYSDMLAQADSHTGVDAVAEPVSFSCQLDRSATRPTSAHKLRPGDIEVIAALGDSLTAANGARATSVLGLLTEYRGYAWSIGGEVNLAQHTTLANVLKHENTKLYGHSTGSGSVTSKTSFLNVAEPGKVASDMPGQARSLVTKLKGDAKVDFNNHWKLITLFIGGNDVCNFCKDKSVYSVDNYVKHIRDALDYLHANVPKAFVNVVEVLDVSLVKELKDGSSLCSVLQGSLLCRCGAFPANAEEERQIKEIVAQYQTGLRALVDSGRYDTREDFTVVNQPFLRNSVPPKINGKYDQTYFAPDCFHFSQKGHSESAKGLWNNMIEPVGQKSTQWTLGGPFKCPTSTRPFLSTRKN